MERRLTASDRRGMPRRRAVFAVKRSQPGGIQLCQAEDIAPGGITILRPRGASVQPATEVSLAFALPGSAEEIATRGVVTNDGVVGGFRRTGVRFIALRPEHARLIAGYCRETPRSRRG
jgi:c-di-GMP-binding flagellar brake protein YcgR